MSGLYFLIPVMLTIFISFLVVRAAAIALMMTGLDKKRAVFQALSAFTGTGFTTREAEKVINHPLRRKIIVWLMILGNAGIVAVIITATSSLIKIKGYGIPLHIVIMFAGIYVIYRIGTSRGFINKWENFIEKKLMKLSHFEEESVEDLLHLLDGYGLVQIFVKKESPVAGLSLSECVLCREDTLLIGIERNDKWIPIPKGQEKIQEGDRLVLYGNLEKLRQIIKNP